MTSLITALVDLCVHFKVKHRAGSKKVAVIHREFVLQQHVQYIFYQGGNNSALSSFCITIKLKIFIAMPTFVLALCPGPVSRSTTPHE